MTTKKKSSPKRPKPMSPKAGVKNNRYGCGGKIKK